MSWLCKFSRGLGILKEKMDESLKYNKGKGQINATFPPYNDTPVNVLKHIYRSTHNLNPHLSNAIL